MNTRRAFGGRVFVFTITNAIGAAVPFLMLPILTRVLSPDDYGKAALFSVVISLLSAFTGLNVNGALGIRYAKKDVVDFPRYVSSCLLVLVGSSALVFCGVWIFLPLLGPATHLPGAWLLAAVLVSGVQFVVLTQLAIWQFGDQPWKYGAMRIAQSTLDASFSLVFIFTLGFSWTGRASGIAVAAALTGAASYVLMRRAKLIRFPASREYVMDALRFGMPLVPHVVGGLLIAMIDRLMIGAYLSAASTGIYTVALQIGLVLGVATDAFNRAYAPWLIRVLGERQPRRDVIIVRFTYVYFAIVALIAVCLGIAAPPILGLIVGEKFRSAAPLVIYITLGFAFGGMYYMVANYVFFAGRTAHLAGVTLVCGLLNVGLCYVLLHRNGAIGAAQAFMLAQALLFAGTWWLANLSRPMPWFTAVSTTA